MNIFMLWMSGTAPGIFSVMIVGYSYVFVFIFYENSSTQRYFFASNLSDINLDWYRHFVEPTNRSMQIISTLTNVQQAFQIIKGVDCTLYI